MKLRRLSLAAIVPVLLMGCGDSDNTNNTYDSGADADGSILNDGSTDGARPDGGDGSTPIPDGTSPDGNVGDGANPNGDGGDGGETGPVEESVKINEAVLRDAVLAGESITGSVLPTVKGLIGTFIDEDRTLVLTASEANNAANIAHRVDTGRGACKIALDHVSGEPDFDAVLPGGCVLDNGLVAKGDVRVQVSKTTGGDAGATTLSVKFTFTGVQAGGATFSGTATVSTSDLENYPTLSDLTITSLGTLTFDGKGTIVAPGDAGGQGSTATIDGTGTYVKASGDAGVATLNPGTDGWSCSVKPGAKYQVVGLSRALNECFPKAGSIVVTKDFTCTKGTWTKDISTTTTLTTSTATASSGQVNIVVASTQAGADAGTSGVAAPVTLPWTCPIVTPGDGGTDGDAGDAADAVDAPASEVTTDAAEAG